MSTDVDNGSPRMSLRIDEVLQQMVKDAVAEGPYLDESEFYREALRAHLRRVNGRDES